MSNSQQKTTARRDNGHKKQYNEKIIPIGVCRARPLCLHPFVQPDPRKPKPRSNQSRSPPQPQKQAELAFADVVGANTLYIASGSATGKGTEATNNLFKIDANGSVSAVTFKDKEGSLITHEVCYVRNLSEKYIYLRSVPYFTKGDGDVDLEGEGGSVPWPSYVVRKTDGATFVCKELAYLDDETEVQTDHDQNVYCQAARFGANGYYTGRYLGKMYDNNNGVSVMQLNKEYMEVSEYLVNPKGDVLFTSRNLQTQNTEYWCYTTSGAFVKSEWGISVFVLKQMPENFYQLKFSNNGSSVSVLKLKSIASEMTLEVLIDRLEMNGEVMYVSPSSPSYPYTTYTLDQVTILLCNTGLFPEFTPMILHIESEKSYKFVPLNRTAWPKALKGGLKLSKEYLYGFNTDEIYRISINTGIVETLYANKEYSINSFSVGADDVLIFSALELSKARDVVCEVRGGQLKILQADDSQKIIQLERIN